VVPELAAATLLFKEVTVRRTLEELFSFLLAFLKLPREVK
jgi:hypothetical protein